MFILHLDLIVNSGFAEKFSQFYREVFRPAIAQQPGFAHTQLLLPRSESPRTHRLVVAFESEARQQQWQASALHQEVAIQFQACLEQVCSVDSFDAV